MNGSKARKYPPQSGLYRVIVKNGAKWREFDTVRLEISVGGPNHEGNKLAATAAWVRARFSRTIVCVNDTLQRFNLVFEQGLSEAEAYDRTAEEGVLWVARNRAALDVLPGLEVHHWDDWKADPGFAAVDGLTHQLRLEIPALDTAIKEDAEAIWVRRQRQSPDIYRPGLKDEFTALSDRYIEEELDRFAVILPRARAVDLYPGSLLHVWSLLEQFFPGTEGLVRGTFTQIDFRRNPSPVAVSHP